MTTTFFQTMRVLFLLFSVLILTNVHAQLLNTTEITPHIGQQYNSLLIMNGPDIQVGNAGINQTWNLSNVIFDADTFIVKQAVATSTTPHSSLFPSATMALKSFYTDDPGNISYSYYTDTGTTFCLLGYVGALTQIYSNPLVEFQFPFGYNNHVNDNFCFESSGFGSTFDFCGTSDMHFDGVGNLILPYGTYNGVYRMKHTRKSWQPSSPGDTSVSISYQWYKPGIRHALATVNYFTGSTGATIVGGNILSLSTINSIEEAEMAGIHVYPNPFLQCVTINLDEPVQSPGTVTVYGIDGKIIHQQTISDKTEILQLEHLPAGIYLLTLQYDGNTRRQLLMKE